MDSVCYFNLSFKLCSLFKFFILLIIFEIHIVWIKSKLLQPIIALQLKANMVNVTSLEPMGDWTKFRWHLKVS